MAKGTIYLLVDSKEALFASVLEFADSPGLISQPVLPIESTGLAHATGVLKRRLKHESEFPTLLEATLGKRPQTSAAN